MEPLEAIDDLEIQRKVESLAGKGTRVVDCEKSTNFQTEEILLVNGYPVTLNGEEGVRIKKALIAGRVPPSELLNEILMRAGILKAPIELETTVNTKSTTRTTEVLTLRDKHGTLVDERMKEVEEDNEFQSKSTEVWKSETESTPISGLGRHLERITLPSHSLYAPSPNQERRHERQESTSTSTSSSSFSSSPSPRVSLSPFSSANQSQSLGSPSFLHFSDESRKESNNLLPKTDNATTNYRISYETFLWSFT